MLSLPAVPVYLLSAESNFSTLLLLPLVLLSFVTLQNSFFFIPGKLNGGPGEPQADLIILTWEKKDILRLNEKCSEVSKCKNSRCFLRIYRAVRG